MSYLARHTIGKPRRNKKRHDSGWSEWRSDGALLLLPFIVLKRLVDVPIGSNRRVVPKWVSVMARGCGLGTRAAAVILGCAYAVSAAVAVCYVGGLLFIGDLIGPMWVFAASLVLTAACGWLTYHFRRATAMLESLQPLCNETADDMPIDETLVRCSIEPSSTGTGELLKPAIEAEYRVDELLRSSGKPND
jgi:hypothetical protein